MTHARILASLLLIVAGCAQQGTRISETELCLQPVQDGVGIIYAVAEVPMPLDNAIFGSIDPERDTFWEAEITIDGRTVRVDLNIDDSAISLDLVAAALAALEDARGLANNARAAIRGLSPSDAEGSRQLYFEHHRDELSAETLAKALGLDDVAKLSEDSLVAGMELQRIGVYPHRGDATFVVDFGLAGGVTNYLLVVKLDARGKPSGVDMES